MKIGVMGTGNVGRALGFRAAQAGHEIVFGSRNVDSDNARQLSGECPSGMSVGNWQQAADHAEVLLLAVPWSAAQQAVTACGDLSHCVLVDCINPLKPDMSGLDLQGAASASHRLVQWAPTARVVKAFNSVSAATMADPIYDGKPATLFYCGDGEEDKQLVDQLATDLGFEAVDAGPLGHATHLESLAMLYIHLAINGWGANCAFKVLRRG